MANITEKDYLVRYMDQAYLNMWQQPEEDRLYFNQDGLYLESFSGWGLPPSEISAVKTAYSDGEYISSYKLGIRDLTMNISSDGCGRDEYWERRKKLIEYMYPVYYSRPFDTSVVPERYLSSPAEFGSWISKFAVDSNGKVHGTYTGFGAYRYSRGAYGPTKWVKQIGDKEYHVYAHYVSGLDYSPRSLDEWHEWGVNESVSLAAYDPYVYLSKVREVNFLQTVAPGAMYQISVQNNGNAQAQPVIELDNWGQQLTGPGTSVTYTIDFPNSILSGNIEESDQYDRLIITLDYNEIQNATPFTLVLQENTRLVINLTQRGKGIYIAEGITTGPGTSAWTLHPAMYALKDAPAYYASPIRAFTYCGLPPAPAPVSKIASGRTWVGDQYILDLGDYFDVLFEPEFDENGDMIQTGYHSNNILIDSDSSNVPVSGSLIFMETYGGI